MSSSSTTQAPADTTASKSSAPWWHWAAIALMAVAVRLPNFYLPMNRDSGLFAYGGWRILHGALPYADFWDNKLPGVFYVNALAMKLFGVSTTGILLFQMLYAAATVCVFYAIISRLCSRRAALITTLAFAFYHGCYGLGEEGNYTESYVALPVLLSVLLMVKWSKERRGYVLPLLAGALGLAAGLIKQPAAAVVPAALVYVLATGRVRERWLSVGAVIAGAGLVAAALVVWMAHVGILHDAVEANLVFNRLYFKDAYTDGLRGGLWNLVRGLDLVALPLVGALVGALVLRRRNSVSSFAWFFIPWFLFDLLGVAMGGRFYNHYFLTILPSSFMLTALAVDSALRTRRSAAIGAAAAVVLFVGPVWSISSSVPKYRPFPVNSIAQQEYHVLNWIVVRRLGDGVTMPAEQIAKWVRDNTQESDMIYVWGWDTRVGFLAKRAFASRYLHMHPLGATGFNRDARIRELARDIEKKRPRYIIDGNPLMPTTAPPLTSPSQIESTSDFFRLDGYEPVQEVVKRYYRPVEVVAGAVVWEKR